MISNSAHRYPVASALCAMLFAGGCSAAPRHAEPRLAGFRLGEALLNRKQVVTCHKGTANPSEFDFARVDSQALARTGAGYHGGLEFCGALAQASAHSPPDSVDLLYVGNVLMRVRVRARELPTWVVDLWRGRPVRGAPVVGQPDAITSSVDKGDGLTFQTVWYATQSRPWQFFVTVGSGPRLRVSMELDVCEIALGCPLEYTMPDTVDH